MGEIGPSDFKKGRLSGESVSELLPAGTVSGNRDCDACKEMIFPAANFCADAIEPPLYVSNGVETGPLASSILASEKPTSPPPNDNVASLDTGIGKGASVSGGEEIGEGCLGIQGSKEEEEARETHGLEPGSAVENSNLERTDGEECRDFLNLSPLRTPASDELCGNSPSMDLRVGLCVSGGCNDPRGCKECKGVACEPPESVTDYPLTTDAVKQSNCFLQDAAVSSFAFETNWMDSGCRDRPLLGPEQTASKTESASMPCLMGSGIEEKMVCSTRITDEVSSDDAKVEQKEYITCSLPEETDAAIQGFYEQDRCSILCIEAESCTVGQQKPNTPPLCFAEEFASQQRLSVSVGHCPLKQNPVPDSTIGSDGVVTVAQTFSSSATDSCGQEDSEWKDTIKSNLILISRRSNPKRAASSRSTCSVTKPDQLTKRNKAKRSKKAIDNSTIFSSSSFWLSLKKVRRKRGSRKMSRASDWGTAGILYEIFNHIDNVPNCNTELIPTKRKSRKVRRSEGRSRKSKVQIAARGARVNCAASTNSPCLKDRETSQTIIPAQIESLVSATTGYIDSLHDNDDHTKAGCVAEQVLVGDGSSTLQLPHLCENLEDPVLSLERDVQHGEKDVESSVTQENSVENNHGDFPGASSQVGSGSSVELDDDRLLNYPGTSPESDVIHPTTDVCFITSDFITSTSQNPSPDTGIISQNICAPDSRVQDNLDLEVSTHEDVLMPLSISCLQQYSCRKKKKNIKIQESQHQLSETSLGKRADDLGCLKKAREPATCSKSERKVGVSADLRNSYQRKGSRKSSKKGSDQKGFRMEDQSLETAEVAGHEPSDVQAGQGILVLHGQDVGKNTVIKGAKTGVSKCRKVVAGPSRARRSAHLQNSKEMNSGNKHKTKKSAFHQSAIRQGSQALDTCVEGNGAICTTGPDIANAPLTRTAESTGAGLVTDGNIPFGDKVAYENVPDSGIAPLNDKLVFENSGHGSKKPCRPPRDAWVCCDDCEKWRCIPSELADILKESKCKWTCRDNDDKAFADCSIPQCKTNAEINAELDISDEEDSSAPANSKGPGSAKLIAKQPSSWTRIKSNLFLYRSRKTQPIDEIMICQCKPPPDGSFGCGDQCINRVLNIECVRGTCPCGDLCSNRQFQKRKYAKLKWFPCGKKGYGLQLLENVSQGRFLIEYVGEVLDSADYEARQREYASRGQKHFYFMTLNGSEVIDACAKGNLGRFINHSCDPNCRTEKWIVNGEVCIGLFAIRDIKKGEEVTFDYNYVRVFGAAAKKCVCGSAECRGYIGGDPLNSENIVQGDSDEEDPEPVMVCEDGEKELKMEKRNEENELIMDEKILDAVVKDFQSKEISPQTTDTLNKSPYVKPELENSLQAVDATSTPPKMYCMSKSTPAIVDNKKPTPDRVENRIRASKSHASKKPSQSGTIKKYGSGVDKLMTSKPKKTIGGCWRVHFDGAEEKLNELLDADGGISKRKDATKGYLKLLIVTAALRDNGESEAIQSTRDLSLILDAILQTRSKSVLTDIINKNGLQILHNIMKQNRGNNNKIPILRKLLKVLDFLAQKEILTPVQINMRPSCAGVESFQDTIIGLTRHSDKQVLRFARCFADTWIHRITRKANLSEKGDGSLDSHRKNPNCFSAPTNHHRIQDARETDVMHCVGYLPSTSSGTGATSESSTRSQVFSGLAPLDVANLTNGAKPRKRKSRWDQDKPSKKNYSDPQVLQCVGDGTAEASLESIKTESSSQSEKPHQMIESGREVCFGNGAALTPTSRQQDVDEAPPGFGSPPGCSYSPSSGNLLPSSAMQISGEVVVGQLQERYCSHLMVSHGIPLALMRQLGTPANEDRGNRRFSSWTVAPGMPFHPFPPLPPYPWEKVKPSPMETSSNGSNNRIMAQDTIERPHPTAHLTASSTSDHSIPSISGETPFEVAESSAIGPEIAAKGKRSLDGSNKGFFQPRRCNSHGYHRFRSLWPCRRSSRQFNADTTHGMHARDPRNAMEEVVNDCVPEGARGEVAACAPAQHKTMTDDRL